MKQILTVIESALFRDYINFILEGNNVEVKSAINPADGISKMRNLAPDLIILDWLQDHRTFMELLKEKKKNPNAAKKPIIILSRNMEQRQLLELVPHNVKKVFNKPIKIDAFFATLSEIMEVPFKIDESPGIMEVHVNENIIFVEIAKGLNRDKLGLLPFKISELIDLYKIRIPKILVMLSDMKLDFTDTLNLQKLMFTILDAARSDKNNIRVLTNDTFFSHFIQGQKELEKIEVVTSLPIAINGLLAGFGKRMGENEDEAELLGDMILQAKTGDKDEDMVFKFDAEEKKISKELTQDSIQNLKIAIIDDDEITRELIKNTFEKVNSYVYAFTDGAEFLNVLDTETFDLAFLDLMMPKVDGFEVLRTMQTRNINYPIIVLSAISQRETMLRVIQMGIKSYLIKPLKPEDIFRKSMEILKANF